MADDTTLGAAVGVGDKISTDDLGTGTKVQRVKVQYGADGSATDASTSNPLPVDLSGAAAADGGTLPGKGVQVGGTDGSVFQVLSTDNAGRANVNVNGTVPVSAAALPLPAGAATAAKQPALGTAGSASADVLSVQGVASMTALKVDGSGVTQPVSGTVTATGPLTDTQLRASAVPVADGGGSLTVDNAGTFAVQIAANSSVNQAQVSGTAVSVNSGIKDAGTQRVVLATDQPQLTTALKVDGSAVTQPVSGTVTASNATGNVAHDGVDSGSPVKIGARARTSDITAVAADDRTDAVADILGKTVVMPYALPGAATDGTANSTGTGDTSVIAAPGAGVRLYITCITVTNAHATVGTKVSIKDGTTAKLKVYAAAAGGGAIIPLPVPLRLTANTALQFANATTGADVDVSAVGYTAAA
jgi:hypothetical protein